MARCVCVFPLLKVTRQIRILQWSWFVCACTSLKARIIQNASCRNPNLYLHGAVTWCVVCLELIPLFCQLPRTHSFLTHINRSQVSGHTHIHNKEIVGSRLSALYSICSCDETTAMLKRVRPERQIGYWCFLYWKRWFWMVNIWHAVVTIVAHNGEF